jgi:hypothetical protein
MSAAHWGWFVKDEAWNYSYQLASDALSQNGFRQFQDGRWNVGNALGGVIGGNNNTIVQVSYAPEDNFRKIAYQVTAFSDDSDQAAAARSKVRQAIVNSHRID